MPSPPTSSHPEVNFCHIYTQEWTTKGLLEEKKLVEELALRKDANLRRF